MKKEDIRFKLCPECMAAAMKNGVCSVCGYTSGDEPEYEFKKALRPGTILNSKYVLGKVISHSRFSTVYYAYDYETEKRVIAECVIDAYNRVPHYTRAVKDVDGMIRECSAYTDRVRSARIDGLITYIDCIECKGMFFLISEFYEGTALHEYLDEKGRLSAGDTIDILREIGGILEEMHENGFVNACITTDKIIITEKDELMLKDSDCFALLFADEKEKMVENPYIASDFYGEGNLTPAADVYSMAAICYKMLSGVDIPTAPQREYDDDIKNPNEFGANITDDAFEVLKNALAVYPEDRIKSVSEFIDEFEAANEAVLEIENDLITDFDFDEDVHTKSDNVKKKVYKGIHPAVKIVIIVLLALLFICEGLVFSGLINPVFTLLGKDIKTPDVTGLTLEQAKRKLKDSGLNILVVDTEDKGNANTVYKQDPTAEDKIARGDIVCITASTGEKGYEPDTMPNVKYMKLDKAFDLLHNKCGYNITISLVTSNDVMAGCVVDQSEQPGAEVFSGADIELTVSTGSLLQSQRIKISGHMNTEHSAVIFMDNDNVYAVRVTEAGQTLGDLMPSHPSEKLHDGLSFIGWSRAPKGTGGEFTNESSFSGVIIVFAFFANQGTEIATPTPEPTFIIEEILPTASNTAKATSTPVMPVYTDIPTESAVLPVETPEEDITPGPTEEVTPTPNDTPTPEPTPEPTPTPTPTPEPTPEPTPTPTPEPTYYLDGLSFTQSEVVIRVGKTVKLTVQFNGNPKNRDLVFRSSNEKIVTVNQEGEITGIGVGEAYIYAFSKTYNTEARCLIRVIEG